MTDFPPLTACTCTLRCPAPHTAQRSSHPGLQRHRPRGLVLSRLPTPCGRLAAEAKLRRYASSGPTSVRTAPWAPTQPRNSPSETDPPPARNFQAQNFGETCWGNAWSGGTPWTPLCLARRPRDGGRPRSLRAPSTAPEPAEPPPSPPRNYGRCQPLVAQGAGMGRPLRPTLAGPSKPPRGGWESRIFRDPLRLCRSLGRVNQIPDTRYHSSTHPLTHSPTHPLTHSPTHPLTHSPTHPLSNSPTQPLTHSPTHPLTHSPTHPLTHSPTHPSSSGRAHPARHPSRTPPWARGAACEGQMHHCHTQCTCSISGGLAPG